MKNRKQIINEILEMLPWKDRQKVIEAGKKYRNETQEELSPEVVERLYLKVVAEAKDRGK